MPPEIDGVYRPQLATLVKTPPEGDEWLHELKLDGYRIGAVIAGGKVTLISRTGKDWTAQFLETARAVQALMLRDSILDGELCAVLASGKTSFHAMQHFRSGRATLIYFVFDALRLNGIRLSTRRLEDRKGQLAKVLPRDGPVRYVDHVIGRGADTLAAACSVGAEGIVSKLRAQPYLEGERKGWLKTKCTQRQEFVVGGFREPSGTRREGIGALYLGYYDDNKRLTYVGKVGTGWDRAMSLELRAELEPLLASDMPFVRNVPAGTDYRDGHWVRPRLVVEVAFVEITPDGHIRHPSFQGIRKDKRAAAVRLELPSREPQELPRKRGREGRNAR